ncbi:MAG: DegV family protein [Firmicutes bacterium]|nr:DegV family protein [Bacillota bacterium]
MSKIIISFDRTADVSPELVEKHNFKIADMGIYIGETLHSDRDVTVDDIYRAMDVDNIVPRTSAGLETDYRTMWEEATANGGEIIHFNISAKLSASHGNAKRAAEGLSGVYVIDSKTLSFGIGMLAVKAAEMRDAGMSAPEIVEKISAIRDVLDVGFIINDLKYLYKGGRVSGLKLLGANLLKIRPSLDLDPDGKMVPGRKYKGNFAMAVREYIKHRIEGNPNADKSFVAVVSSHMDDPSLPQMMADELRAAGFVDVIILPAGPSITVHCGRNTIGAVIANRAE